MKVIEVGKLVGTDREVRCPQGGFTSYRSVLASDAMGFSLHKTVIPKGLPQHWHYKHHLEACYCISGRGLLTDIKDYRQYEVVPDTVYVLDEHDDHFFQALEETTLLCVFNPPVTGREVHRADGSYATEGDADVV